MAAKEAKDCGYNLAEWMTPRESSVRGAEIVEELWSRNPNLNHRDRGTEPLGEGTHLKRGSKKSK